MNDMSDVTYQLFEESPLFEIGTLCQIKEFHEFYQVIWKTDAVNFARGQTCESNNAFYHAYGIREDQCTLTRYSKKEQCVLTFLLVDRSDHIKWSQYRWYTAYSEHGEIIVYDNSLTPIQ